MKASRIVACFARLQDARIHAMALNLQHDVPRYTVTAGAMSPYVVRESIDVAPDYLKWRAGFDGWISTLGRIA